MYELFAFLFVAVVVVVRCCGMRLCDKALSSINLLFKYADDTNLL